MLFKYDFAYQTSLFEMVNKMLQNPKALKELILKYFKYFIVQKTSQWLNLSSTLSWPKEIYSNLDKRS